MDKTELINRSIHNLKEAKQFAWECGLWRVVWSTVKDRINRFRRIRAKGQMAEIAICYLFGYMNLPMQLTFSEEDDRKGADLVFKKTKSNATLKIQLKWNNHSKPDEKYIEKGCVVVHIDDGMKPAEIVNQFQFANLFGKGNWQKYFPKENLLLIKKVLEDL